MKTLQKYLCEMEAKMADSIYDVEYITCTVDSQGFLNGRTFESLNDVVLFWTEWVEDLKHPDVKKLINSLKKLKPGEHLMFKDNNRKEYIILRLAGKPVDNIVVK